MKKTVINIISGLLALVAYLLVIGLLIFYFNTNNQKKPDHFVKKNEHRIAVKLSSPKSPKATKKVAEKKIKEKSKPKKKSEPKKKKKIEKAKEKEPEKKSVKKVIKEKIVKKVKKKVKKEEKKPKKDKIKKEKPKKEKAKKTEKKEPTKKKNTLDLFADLKTSKKETKKKENIIKLTDKSKNKISTEAKKNSDSGIENKYIANIEEKLSDWPAQSEYAGEIAKVSFTIEVDGSFEFRITSASNNSDFNEGLEAYLEQLKRFGFGHHRGDRAYEINVEFVAKE